MNIVHRPMTCCGMLQADTFSWVYFKNKSIDGTEFDDHRRATKEEKEKYFKKIEKEQYEECRNCALISLSSEQKEEIELAKAKGYKEILKFYNPNSGNYVYLFAKVLWEDFSDYREDIKKYLAKLENENSL